MAGIIVTLLRTLVSILATHRKLALEDLALRQQVAVLRRSVKRPRLEKWTGQQIVEAFPWDFAPRYLRRDRDGVYGCEFSSRVEHMGIKQGKTAARLPWQNPHVERMIGTLRRDCLDHVIVFNQNHLRRILRDYLNYYHGSRTHLSLHKDSPEPRSVKKPDQGSIVEFPMVGGLHHRYSRLAV